MTDPDPKAKAREAALDAMIERMEGEGWNCGKHDGPDEAAEARAIVGMAFDAGCAVYERALKAPTEGATRLVRIAVAGDGADNIDCIEFVQDGDPWWELLRLGFRHPLAIVTARIPVREVPVIQGDVEEAG